MLRPLNVIAWGGWAMWDESLCRSLPVLLLDQIDHPLSGAHAEHFADVLAVGAHGDLRQAKLLLHVGQVAAFVPLLCLDLPQ